MVFKIGRGTTGVTTNGTEKKMTALYSTKGQTNAMAAYGAIPVAGRPAAGRGASLRSVAVVAVTVVAAAALLLIATQTVCPSPNPALRRTARRPMGEGETPACVGCFRGAREHPGARQLQLPLGLLCPGPGGPRCSRAAERILHPARVRSRRAGGSCAGAAAKVCAHIFHARARCLWLQTQQSILANVDKDDGSDALVNAILVARGDALPTQFAGAFSSSSLRLGGGASPGVHALTISHKCMGVSPGDPGAM